MQQKAFKSQWPQRHLDVPEKAVGTKKWCNSGNTPNMAFSPEAEDGAISAWCDSVTWRQPACIEFPLNCREGAPVNVAVTEQRHRGALSPSLCAASSPKGPEHFCFLLCLHKRGHDKRFLSLWLARFVGSSRGGVCPSTRRGGRFTEWPWRVRKIWWQRGLSGPRRTPEPPAVPCPYPPRGTPPPPPRLEEEKNTSTCINTHE